MLRLEGEVCEIGDVLPDTPGFRMALIDGRVIAVIGLTHEEVRSLPFLQNATLTVAAGEPPSQRLKVGQDGTLRIPPHGVTPCQTEQECEAPDLCRVTNGCERMEPPTRGVKGTRSVDDLMELARQYAHAYFNHATGSSDGMLEKTKAALRAALADGVAMPSLSERVRAILHGIDMTETEHADGWWETSTGADFGAGKLRELLAALGVGGTSNDL